MSEENPFDFPLERLWKDPESEWHPVEDHAKVYETLKINYDDIDGIVEMLDNGHEIQTMGAYYRKDTTEEQRLLNGFYDDTEISKS
jgi:hypothetical protein